MHAHPIREPSTRAGRPRSGSTGDETRWSRIHAGDYDYLVRRFWKPIRRFLIGRMVSPDEAEDLTQELFLAFIEKNLLARADPARGSFRSFVFHVARQLLIDRRRFDAAEKRGAGRTVPLDPMHQAQATPADRPEDEFDREWYLSLFNRARRDVKRHYARRPEAYEAFRLYFFGEPGAEQPTYEEIADRLGQTEAQVRNNLHRSRKVFVEKVVEAIAEYVGGEAELRAELGHLVRFVSGRLDPEMFLSGIQGEPDAAQDDGQA